MSWPTTWVSIAARTPTERDAIMSRTARDVASQAPVRLWQAVSHLTGASEPLPVDDVTLDVRWLQQNPVLLIAALAEAAAGPLRLRHGHDRASDDAHGVDGGYHATHPLFHQEARFWTRRGRRRVTEECGRRYLTHAGRVVAMIGEVRRLGAMVAGDLPVHDNLGTELTGAAALTRRQEIYEGELCAWWRLINDSSALRTRIRNAVEWDLPHDALSSDLPVAKAQLLERIDDAAADHLCYLFDAEEPSLARPFDTEQQTAARLLSSRRQAGRRTVLAAETVAAAAVASRLAVSRIEGVGIEHAPQWRDATGNPLVLTAGRLRPTWAAPASGQYTINLRVARGSERAGEHRAVLDLARLPKGWTVSMGSQTGAGATAVWPVTVTAPTAPPPGAYDFDLVARDVIGPSRLPVTVVVPAPSAG